MRKILQLLVALSRKSPYVQTAHRICKSQLHDAGTKDNTGRLGFVSAGVESQTDGVPKVSANNEYIELPDESDSDDDGRVEITQKDIPEAVYEKNEARRVKVPRNISFEYDVVKMSKQNLVKFVGMSIKPCWITRPSRNGWEESKGFIIFSLTSGPEYHVSQIEIVYDYGKEEAEAL